MLHHSGICLNEVGCMLVMALRWDHGPYSFVDVFIITSVYIVVEVMHSRE